MTDYLLTSLPGPLARFVVLGGDLSALIAASYPSAGIAVSTGSAWDTSLNAGWIDQDVSVDGTPTFANLTVTDSTVDTTEHYIGIESVHTKTAGVTDTSDHFRSASFRAIMDQSGGVIGSLLGMDASTSLLDGTVDYMYGLSYSGIVTTGTTVNNDIFASYKLINISSGATLSGNVYGDYTSVDTDTDPSGNVYGYYLFEGSNVDFGYYQNGTSPNYFGGNITTGGSLNAEQLNIINSTIDTSHGWVSIFNINTKTAGATDSSDVFWGQWNGVVLNQSGGNIGEMIGFKSSSQIQDGTADSSYGTKSDSSVSSGATVTNDLVGWYSRAIANSGSSVGGDIIGVHTLVSAGSDPTGLAYGFYLEEAGSYVDYGYYQDGSSPNHFGGTINTEKEITQNSALRQASDTKTLADGVTTGLFEVAIASGEMVGGQAHYTIYVSDGTDLQAHSGILTFVGVNKAGTVSSDIDEVYLVASETEVTTSGTLSNTFSITDGTGKITVNLNANTSLTPTSMEITYTVTLNSSNIITLL